MRVVFADVDGVLVTPGTRPVGSLDPALVARLDRLCREAGAVVVLSSSWRVMGLDALRAKFARAGFTGEIVGMTPDRSNHDAPRGLEIGEWLIYHFKEVSHFVILDDDADMLSLAPEHVQTRATTGLTDADVVRALAVLQGATLQGAVGRV